ncbi:uncharacterized protein BDZ99DRAFT_506630 [Mytilinidion resinicola]|uniref:ATP-dependent protease-like protein n=1 Tax=Mytilinidion resinicola TaxID=574789 RepID=A0A6A6YZ25_9PEZI|nr:uncharacterized protein BDZ99DRAFT_506630 [Mytilinidion resinicola]KAF2813693.1 hypothetical protein BDZ99DRAFT_506630 [Mytilinidion resinicola]
MSLLQRKGSSFTNGEEPSFDASLGTPALMKDHEATADVQELLALSAHEDARQLVRLIQCSQCSKPLRIPITLPCGHSMCRSCLPEPRLRENISYPDTPDRQYGIPCPILDCGAEHPTGECNPDVTLAKIMEVIATQVAKHQSVTENTPIRVDVFSKTEEQNVEEKEKVSPFSHSRILNGGRLVSTFILAELGELPFDSSVAYQSLATTDDDYQTLDASLLDSLREAAHKELDCHVCYNLMLEPTTTPCGHTFCRKCLARVLDHANLCPVCRRSLSLPPSLVSQPSNGRLVDLLNSLCPEVMTARAAAVKLEESLEGTALNTPLFVCTLSLPATPTFLHVFEPRYRLMMRRALDGNRQFGMVMYNRSRAPQGDLGNVPFMEYGTILEITNVQILGDGRSYVESRGVGRFRIREYSMLDGYYVSQVERVEDVSLAEEERLEAEETTTALAAALEAQMHIGQHQTTPTQETPASLKQLSTRDLLLSGIEFIERMRANSAPWLNERILIAYGGPPADPALFPYWFASVLPIAEDEKYLLLKTMSVRERLKIVNRWIQRIERQRLVPAHSSLPRFASAE